MLSKKSPAFAHERGCCLRGADARLQPAEGLCPERSEEMPLVRRLTRQHRSTQRKWLTSDPRTELRLRMREISQTRVRYGYRRIHIMLKREGWDVGKHVVYRLYREEGLCLRRKRPRRRKMSAHRQSRPQPTRSNEVWSMDFMSDQLASGPKIRLLTVIDVFTLETL